MTKRLYYHDAYTTSFEATVTAVESAPDGRSAVILDATLFYPTSGGQMHDRGSLGGAIVHDVVDEGHRILHVIEGPKPEVGAVVQGEVDAERRRGHRQQHSGQHVLSRILEERLDLATVSSRLGEGGNTLDLAVDHLEDTTLDEIEDLANRVLWDGHAVHVHFLDEKEAARWGLRKKVDRAGPLRVVEVEGVDRCACGGTHVRNTAEVGLLVITGTEKVKGGTRVNFLCGDRALVWRRERHRWLDRVARRLTTGHDQVESTVERLVHENKESQKRVAILASELVALRARGWLEETLPDARQRRVVIRRLEEEEVGGASRAIREITREPDGVAALLSVDGAKGQLLLGRGEGVDLDCRSALDAILGPVGGRGGGQSGHARGGFPGDVVEQVEAALHRRFEDG